MGKASRAQKRAARAAAEAADRKARAQRQKRRRRYLVLLGLVPVVTAVLSSIAFWGYADRPAAGLIIMTGVALFIPTLLAFLGSGVAPRDRLGAGSIDFGRRR